MTKRLLGVFLLSILCQNYLSAQEKSNIKFGVVLKADFELPKSFIDSNASAVIIADIGAITMEGNYKNGFNTVIKRLRRIKVLNKRGFDIATMKIFLHMSDKDAEKLEDLKVITSNLDNGIVTQAAMDNQSVFTSKYNQYAKIEKFTAAAVKEGSIIDFSYRLTSYRVAVLPNWEFQSEYWPTLVSDFTVTVPSFFHYATITRGDPVFTTNTLKKVDVLYHIQHGVGFEVGTLDVSGIAAQQHWIKKNVPALKEEVFTSTIKNYLSSVSFQLKFAQYDESSVKTIYYQSWPDICKTVLESNEFKAYPNAQNEYLESDVRLATEGTLSDSESVRRIYCYVRNHYTCTSYGSGLWGSRPVKEVFSSRSGTSAEINQLLIAMLRRDGIASDPVVLSTRDNGVANMENPFIDQFNYLIVLSHPNGKTVFMDASRPFNGFGQLGAECFNGGICVVNNDHPDVMYLRPDSIIESHNTAVFISNDEKGFPSGTYETRYGPERSGEMRTYLTKSTSKDFFKTLQADKGANFEIENSGIDASPAPEVPVKVHYEFNIKSFDNAMVYFNPILDPVYQKNPFPAATRNYPVEMGSKIDYTYMLSMEIPAGYVIDELPKSARIAFVDQEGLFDYAIQQNASNIQMRVKIKFSKTFFSSEEYPMLHDFFAQIVKKENEMIVFKKKP